MNKKYKERLLSKIRVNPKSGCWDWIGSIDQEGYGRFVYQGKIKRAHRIAYIILKGKLDPKLMVCHTCDNRGCINPDHLFLGTALDNNQDCGNKKRYPNSKKTECPQGHEYNKSNTIIRYANGRPKRSCKACHKIRYKRWYNRKEG